jgi:hypothetical protein
MRCLKFRIVKDLPHVASGHLAMPLADIAGLMAIPMRTAKVRSAIVIFSCSFPGIMCSLFVLFDDATVVSPCPAAWACPAGRLFS